MDPTAIPQGLATKLGKGGIVVTALLTILAAAFDVEVNAETAGAFASSIALLLATMAGRYAQAAALYRDVPPAFPAPGEDELMDDFPDDAPVDGPTPEVPR